jgi:hypothetical protein
LRESQIDESTSRPKRAECVLIVTLGAAVAIGRGVGVEVFWEAKAAQIAEGEWRADQVPGLVEALAPLNRRCTTRIVILKMRQ